MVYRIFVEKKQGLENEANALFSDITGLLGIKSLKKVRILNRYDAEDIDRELFDYCVKTVFSEPQLDNVYDTVEDDGAVVFAVEYLPGQFDQRADSAAQCIQLISQKNRPDVRTAKVYMLYGELSDSEIESIKKYVINPVESREASLAEVNTLKNEYVVPDSVRTIDGFCGFDDSQLEEFIKSYGLAMDIDDIRFCRDYFVGEKRDPTITEIRMIDTYWSDHCRHTTFLTTVDSVEFEDDLLRRAYEDYLSAREQIGRKKPINLMDIATVAVKYLKAQGCLDSLDESEEINACTVKIKVDFDGKKEDWLLLFKNETHNHPTEIEPFGGAATCIGGAIRDPLSGRAYVYAAMRVTGASDPTVPVSQTMAGKLPQRKIVTTAAAGYSSYGNQIGLATGQVDEIYHSGYVAKRMEIGAVVAAAPAENVRRERPVDGDVVILLGGRTGRDGCGGATGSSKSHTLQSLETCGAEVQKGNAPEERKLQRLFRNKEASLLIKRCNDFGAGGVSVAVGELADGLEIDLNAVPKKYEGLDGTELAISESQERMAVVVAKEDAEKFTELASKENLEATRIARVTDSNRLRMKWNGKYIVDISRDFLNSNGAEKHISIAPQAPRNFDREISEDADFVSLYSALVSDLNVCSKRGLSERFDSTIGAGTVLMPFGGKYQQTPIQAMVQKISSEDRFTDTCSLMSWGYNPYIAEKSPFHSAYYAVVESVSKLVAAGAKFEDVYLTFQEYMEKPGHDPKRWGKPFAALLGAFEAQADLRIGAIGGKDSMSGSFENIDVPPTLVSFAVTVGNAEDIISPEFKSAGHEVIMLSPEYNSDKLPVTQSLLSVYEKVTSLIREGKAIAVYTPVYGGAAEAVFKMCIGNNIGFVYDSDFSLDEMFGYSYGSFIIELSDAKAGDIPDNIICRTVGKTVSEPYMSWEDSKIPLCNMLSLYEGKLEGVYPCNIEQEDKDIPTIEYKSGESFKAASVISGRPRVLIPVFPGTNCEYDSAKMFEKAGASVDVAVIRNLSSAQVSESVDYFAEKIGASQIIFIPGGFSGGDEPDGSGKFITAFFRNAKIKDAVHELLKKRDGLMAGLCNGFQALIKLGLVPYGEIIDTDENCPTLTFNTIGRHQSKLVRTRICTDKSPWLMNTKPGEIYTVPISHGEGRFLASEELVKKLAENGQIVTQYVDLDGKPSSDVHFNPNNSVYAVEGICSPDGRVLGKMGHSERVGDYLYKNVEGKYFTGLFESAVRYYSI